MDIVVRAFCAYLFLLALTRLIGRRELSTLQPFDLILLVVVGDLLQQGVMQSDLSLTGALLAISVVGLMTLGTSYLGFRFKRLRPIFEDEPLILVENGKLVEPNLRRERLTPEEVAAEARQNRLDSLEDVRWAVLESNGKISFISK